MLRNLLHPHPVLWPSVYLVPEAGLPWANFNGWIAVHRPLMTNPFVRLGWTWIIRRRSEAYFLDEAERAHVVQQISVCELSVFEAERNMAQLVENQGLPPPLRRAMMNVALDHVHAVCSITQGLREGEWLIFMPEEEDGHAFDAYFLELGQSFINGPLSLLHGQGATVTAVKASGMSQHHPEHPDPCICVLFEDCWDIEQARVIYDCLQEHHPQYKPYGVKARIYSQLGIYFNNIYEVDVCIYTADDLDDL